MREDFWPDDIVDAADPEPVALLKEQATLLGEKTKDAVEGIVKPSTERGKVYFSLYLKAPALGDYRYKILSIAYPVIGGEPYPVTAQGSSGGPAVEIPNRDDLRAWLRGQLSSDHVRRVIANLLRYSREAPEPTWDRHARDVLERSAAEAQARRSSSGG